MARATEQEVLDIMDNDLTEAQVTPYLTSTNVFVTDALGSKSLSAAILKEIERWLTAHMIASTKDLQAKEEGAGGAEIKYTGYWSTGLLGTNYGQTAISLDSSNTLVAIAGGKKSASITAITSFD